MIIRPKQPLSPAPSLVWLTTALLLGSHDSLISFCCSAAAATCTPDQENNTLYGTTTGSEAMVVIYAYELEVLSTVFETNVTDEILPALEISFAEALLINLFPSQCDGTVAATSVAGLVGLSTLADDVLRTTSTTTNATETCTSMSTSSNTICYVVDGSVTIYWDESMTATIDLTESVTTHLNTGMTNGDFLNAHEGIVRVGIYDASDTEMTTATTTAVQAEAEQITGIMAFLEKTFDPIISWAKTGDTERRVVIYSPFMVLGICLICCCIGCKTNEDTYQSADSSTDKSRDLEIGSDDDDDDSDDDFDDEDGSDYSVEESDDE